MVPRKKSIDLKLTGDIESFFPEMRKLTRLSVLTTSLQRCIESPSQGSKAKREIKSVMIGKKEINSIHRYNY